MQDTLRHLMAMVLKDVQQSTELVSCTFKYQLSSVWIESLRDVNKSFLLNRKKKVTTLDN